MSSGMGECWECVDFVSGWRRAGLRECGSSGHRPWRGWRRTCRRRMEFSGYGVKKSSEDDCNAAAMIGLRMPYWKLYYHLVWATFERHPVITAEREAIVRTTLYAKAKVLRVVLHAVGNVADHVHVVVSIPPGLTVAACVKHLKGASSRAMNIRAGAGFRWQEGYGALSLGERSLSTVVAYVRNQPRHHHEQTTLALYETTDGKSAQQSSSDDLEQP